MNKNGLANTGKMLKDTEIKESIKTDFGKDNIIEEGVSTPAEGNHNNMLESIVAKDKKSLRW